MRPRDLTHQEYAALARFRASLRAFLRFTEREAKLVGLTPRQHQLLLVVRSRITPVGIGEAARELGLSHHAVVGLVDRSVAVGLLRREADLEDRRRVRLRLTPRGARMLARLSQRHRGELRALRRALDLALLLGKGD